MRFSPSTPSTVLRDQPHRKIIHSSYLAFFKIKATRLKFFIARFFYPTVFSVLLLSCESSDRPTNRFSDPVLLKIADFQDRRLADSLYPYFNHTDALYRREAVLAFGSLQDPGDVDKIGRLLLMDGDSAVRKSAAFALGQILHPSCERILLGALVKEKNATVTFEILQAYGKTTKQWKLDPSVFLNDSIKTAGLAWSIYRAGIRGKTDQVVNHLAMRLLNKSYSEKTRLGVAHYFSRGATDFQPAEKALIAAALKDASVNVRMAAAASLGKIPSDSTLATIKKIINTEPDTRVIVNAIRGLSSYPYGQVKDYLYEALHHKDAHVGIAASETILSTIVFEDWIELSTLTNQTKNWRMQANLYAAALKAGKNKDLAREIENQYKKAKDPYQRAALLGSLKHFPAAYAFVENEMREADTAMVRSAAAATLVDMNHSESFQADLTPRFATIYRDVMQSAEDQAVLGSIASALADSTLGYRTILKDPSFLYEARKKLRLPEHNEALQSIEAAIAHFENRKNPAFLENAFNHPIHWELVKTIPEDQLATIKTTRGNIIIRLLVNESPGSVANFIELAQKDYFDNKLIHRVVPNFVIQAGCKRGDGWGSEDYSIRSEFSTRAYQTGSLGMASAGKDTEGTQWFITHSPTPHLDGRYTLFAEVLEGMPVVNYLQVGDKITDVVVENFPVQ